MHSSAVLQQEPLAIRLKRERDEAVELQAASAEVLEIIGSSPGEMKPVFAAMLEKALRICDAKFGHILLYDDEHFHAVHLHDVPRSYRAFWDRHGPIRPGPKTGLGRLARTKRIVHIPDLKADPAYTGGEPLRVVTVDEAGARSFLAVPMLKDDELVGAIVIYRQEVRPFTLKQIELVKTFAAQAVIAIENTRLLKELHQRTEDLSEALEQQTATGEVLKVIASSPTDVGPALHAIVESACVFCNAYDAVVLLKIGNDLHFSAHHGPIRMGQQPRPISREWVVGRSVVDKVPVQVSDFQAPEAAEFPEGQRQSREQGHRCALSVPLLREGEAIGAIAMRRLEPVAFSDKQVALLQTFADQAVIAIGNVRLFEEVQARTRELTESLRQETATSEVLEIISSSPGELEPVFQATLANATRLCQASSAVIWLRDGEAFRSSAIYGPLPAAYVEQWRSGTLYYPNPNSGLATMKRTRKTVHMEDLSKARSYAEGDVLAVTGVELGGIRTVIVVPMFKDEELVGGIAIYRQEVRPFTDKQIDLVTTFAKQAVIAIENARLLRELRERTEDLAESLQQQTATSEVLQVISSSPGDLAPVFEKMLENATRICGAEFGIMLLLEDGLLRPAARYNVPPAFAASRGDRMYPPPPRSVLATAIESKDVAQTADLRTNPAYLEGAKSTVELVELGGARTLAVVPMLRDNEVIGTITIYRKEVRLFENKQIELIRNFAKQAVIAIENARLLKELRQSLQQQTATADVLKIISRSSIDLTTVLETLVETLAQLFRADNATMYRRWDDNFYLVASRGLSEEGKAVVRTYPVTPDRGSLMGRIEMERRPVQIADVLSDPEYTQHELQKILGYRTTLGVPLLRENTLLGIFALNRSRVEPFTEKEIELASTFADQAVIAIENARLFEELRERQAELRVTFDNMGDGVVMFDAAPRLTAWNRNFQEMLELPEAFLARRPGVVEFFRYLADRGEYSADLEAELSRSLDDLSRELRFERTRPDGRVMEVRRNPVPGGGFVLIYADITKRKQAEQAIRAARDAAEAALRDLQMAQTSLVHAQKMAALGQLTAGIAHEIKNPLNFVNNFSALSIELADELNGVLKQASLVDKLRQEADELTSLLKDNLGKVVQHGKRADSIVKNMLLHSREGAGECRTVDINALVDESLNLAYHGARAEKQGFNISLEREFDPTAGTAEVCPQEITRVFLNLISNGFYAANKHAAEAGSEPRLKAATRNLGEKVEIRFRDNGMGIPPDVREKIFNPFFTTKPAGEGTGLGLSLSHDIVVKQHNGTIEVATEPGSFTEFIVRLPRTMAAQAK